jgi:putative addiction module CopG family antidote
LGSYLDQFIQWVLREGRYRNASEAVRFGLRLHEEDEGKIVVMRYTIGEGINSSLTGDCDHEQHLIWKKEKRKVMSNLKVTNNAVRDLSVI